MKIKHTGVKTRPCSEETKIKIREALLQTDLTSTSKKRIDTLLKQDENIFKKIAYKSAITQKINGLNKGINNPNSNENDILIFNELNEIIFITKNSEFNDLCEINNLPIRALIKSKISNGEYKLYINKIPKNRDYLKYKGWYCKYKNK